MTAYPGILFMSALHFQKFVPTRTYFCISIHTLPSSLFFLLQIVIFPHPIESSQQVKLCAFHGPSFSMYPKAHSDAHIHYVNQIFVFLDLL